MKTVKELVETLRHHVESGDIMAAYNRFYAEDIVVKSNDDPPLRGKAENIAAHGQFFSAVKSVHCVVKTVLAGETSSLLEVEYEMVDAADRTHRFSAVAIHDWRGEQIVAERWYKNAL